MRTGPRRKQRREHVRQGNAGDFEHVEADADDKRAADGCELRHGCGGKPALEAAREQCERSLIDKHGDGREQDPEPVAEAIASAAKLSMMVLERTTARSPLSPSSNER